MFYPIWAALTLFVDILLGSGNEQTQADIELLQHVPALFNTMRQRQLGATEELHLKSFDMFVDEIVRQARRAG